MRSDAADSPGVRLVIRDPKASSDKVGPLILAGLAAGESRRAGITAINARSPPDTAERRLRRRASGVLLVAVKRGATPGERRVNRSLPALLLIEWHRHREAGPACGAAGRKTKHARLRRLSLEARGMHRHRLYLPVFAAVAALIMLCGAFHSRVRSDDRNDDAQPSKADIKIVSPEKSALHRTLDESAGQYAIYAEPPTTDPLKLRCVLRWANQTRGSVDGATYIWTSRGRPMAAVCCYPWYGDICDNFQSLARASIRAERDGDVVWKPKAAGVSFEKVPDAPVPADSAAARLREMKTLARSFSVTLLGWAPGDPDREELRLLQQPVYRYECDESELLDGALFAFVQGTDPEALLLIEAVPAEAGAMEFEWEFAFARRTSGWLEARHGERVVWKAEKNPEWRDSTSVYFQLSHRLLKSDDRVKSR
jgi:hypothetical protein